MQGVNEKQLQCSDSTYLQFLGALKREKSDRQLQNHQLWPGRVQWDQFGGRECELIGC